MKRTKKLLVAACIFAFVFSLVNVVQPTQVMAAAKPKLSSTKLTVPLGVGEKYGTYSVYNAKEGYDEMRYTKPLTVKNKVKGATYTFKSSNTKVAKVNAKSGVITGVKTGTAKITCTQKLKGKTTTVGTCKVTVKNPSLSGQSLKSPCRYALGTDTFLTYETLNYGPVNQGFFEGNEVKYEYNGDGLSFSYSEDGQWYYTATKTGVYDVSVSILYNKKWIRVGTRKVEIKDVAVKDLNTGELLYLKKGDYLPPYLLMEFYYAPFSNDDYSFEVANDGVLSELKKDPESFYDEGFELLSEGTTTVKIYKKDGTYIGTSTVTIVYFNE